MVSSESENGLLDSKTANPECHDNGKKKKKRGSDSSVWRKEKRISSTSTCLCEPP